MKALVFPKDQEMFPEIDENGLLRSSGGTDSIARAYEATIEAYTGAHTKAADVTYEKNKDHFERAGISKEKFVRSEDSRKQFLQDLWHKLDKLVEDKSKDSIVRFPKTSYAVHLEKNYYIDHFKNLKDSLNNYNEGWNLGGLVGECFNDTEKKARELQEARKKRKKLWLELPIIALQIIAAVIVLVFGIRITSGSIDSTEEIVKSVAILAFLLLGLIIPALSKVHDKNTFSGLLLHPVVIIMMIVVGFTLLSGGLTTPEDDIVTLAGKVVFFAFYGLLMLSDICLLIKCIRLRNQFHRIFSGKAMQIYHYIRLRALWWKNAEPGKPEHEAIKIMQGMFQKYLELYK